MHPYTSPRRRRLVGGTLAAGLVAGMLGLTAAQADAAPAIGLKGKTLIAKGTGAGDRLALRLHSGAPDRVDVDVGDNGSADLVVARNKVNRIRVKGGGGNDQIRIDDANGAFTTTIPTRIDGQGGNDAIRGGSGAERLNGDGGTTRSTATAATTSPTSARATTASSGIRATASPSRTPRRPRTR
jgi:hypothetical protein